MASVQTAVPDGRAATAAGQYLTFMLGTEEYGVDVLQVQEIIGYQAPTPVPGMPPYMSGVINLRGVVIPVMDARRLLRMPEGAYTRQSAVVVIQSEDHRSGLIVDHVADVVTLEPGQVSEPPRMRDDVRMDCLKGIGQINQRMLILLDASRLMEGAAKHLGEAVQGVRDALATAAAVAAPAAPQA
ncbi:MAG: chemotaxis protein CheW [Planctomycetes bacterium]|nr:chemotaxis protein CheW [Planctomycetota bacterium]